MTPADNITAAEPRPTGWRWFKELGGPWSMPQGQQLPWKRGRVPPSERRRRSTSGREARVGRDRAVRLAAAGNADAERHTSASSRTGEKPMSGYSGAGRKRGHAATAPARYPLLPHPSAKSIAAEACPGISPKRNLGQCGGSRSAA